MLSLMSKYITILVSLVVSAGMFSHGTHFGNAMAMATIPAFAAGHAVVSVKSLSNDHHIHVDGGSFSRAFSFGSQQPATQPRNDNETKYVIQKRYLSDGFGSDYKWPFI